MRARRALRRLEGDQPATEAIADAANHGRIAVVELFRLLTSGKTEAVRLEAGRSLARLWLADELIPEEEKALVTRGFEVRWIARRTYPRGLARSIPIAAEFEVPALRDVAPRRRARAHRMAVEESSARVGRRSKSSARRRPGAGRLTFEVEPGDYAENAPQNLALHARAKTVGLTSIWEHDLPKAPFTFQFDRNLEPSSLLAPMDEARGEAMARAVALEVDADDPEVAKFTPIGRQLAMRGRPVLRVAALPCDLAHAVRLEIEGELASLLAGGIIALRDQPSALEVLPIASDHLPRRCVSEFEGGASSRPPGPQPRCRAGVVEPIGPLGLAGNLDDRVDDGQDRPTLSRGRPGCLPWQAGLARVTMGFWGRGADRRVLDSRKPGRDWHGGWGHETGVANAPSGDRRRHPLARPPGG